MRRAAQSPIRPRVLDAGTSHGHESPERTLELTPWSRASMADIAGQRVGGSGAWAFFGLIGMIIVGFIVGVLARYFYPGAVNMGFWMTAAARHRRL